MRPFSFFNTVRLPYYIYVYGFDFTAKSAGIRALHYLCHALNEVGAEAYLIGCTKESEFLRTPLLRGGDVLRHKKANKTPIVVYPEVTRGNPLNVPFVVRWLLNKAGALGGDAFFSDSEMLFAYTQDYVPEGASIPLLTVPSVNGEIFNNLNNQYDTNRQGSCFYAHKYLLSGGKLTEHVTGAVSLCQDVDLSPSEIAAVLRRSEVLYCYEPSAIIKEALLCGCPIIVIPSTFLDENLSYPIAGPGIASTLDPDEINVAKETVGLATESNNQFIHHCKQHVNNFIPKTQLVFNDRQSECPNNNYAWADNILHFLSILNEQVVKEVTVDTVTSTRLVGAKEVLKIDYYNEWQAQRDLYKLNDSQPFSQMQPISDKTVHADILVLIFFESEDLSLLADTIDSLSAQTVSNWHLMVISSVVSPDKVFDELDSLTWLEIHETHNPYESINKCIQGSGCSWVCLVELGGVFDSYCMASIEFYAEKNEGWSFIYTDEDQLDGNNQRISPKFKPDFNLDLLRSSPYIGDFCFIKTQVLSELGGFYAMPNVENYDLALQVLEYSGDQAIGHIADVLGHRPYQPVREFDTELGLQVLTNHLQRVGADAVATRSGVENSFCVNYKVDTASKISIIISVKDQLPVLKACITSVFDSTSYPDYEVIIVDNQSKEEGTKEYLLEIQILYADKLKVIEYKGSYNKAAIINAAVKQASGEYLVLLNHDTMVLQAEWLHGMLMHAQRKKVGVVGVKLVYPNKTLQHTGLILGLGEDGIAASAFSGKSMDEKGEMNRAMLVQDFSAVSGACLMISKALYQDVGGLNEKDFALIYSDIDLCLKVKALDYKVLWTPYVTLIHHGDSLLEKCKQDKQLEPQFERNKAAMLAKWLPQLSNDPSYNKNLSLKTTDFQVDNSLNCIWNADFKDKPKVYAFPGDSSGVGQYRVRGPLAALTNAGQIESSLANNFDEIVYPTVTEIERIKPDILVSQNFFLDHMLTPWKQYRQFNNAFMISGLDDLVYMLPQYHPKQGKWPSNTRRKVKELFQNSDRVIVANVALAEEFSKMSDDILVVPNYLENWRWDSLNLPEKRNGKKLRIGWAGGQEHIADLEFIRPVVEALHKEVDWIFMGLCLDGFQPYIKENYAGVDFDRYPQLLANLNLDLAIAPLTHNKFNECKTNLRLLEYGMVGWPVVCTDILPYQNAPVTRVANNTNEWIRVIREKINEPEELLREGELLKQWVIDNYMLNDHIDDWAIALLPS